MWVEDDLLKMGESDLMKALSGFGKSCEDIKFVHLDTPTPNFPKGCVESSALNFIEGVLVPGIEYVEKDRGIVIIGCGNIGKTCLAELNIPTHTELEDILKRINLSGVGMDMETLRKSIQTLRDTSPTMKEASERLKESLDSLSYSLSELKNNYDTDKLIDNTPKFRDNPINPHFKKRKNYKRKLKKNKR